MRLKAGNCYCTCLVSFLELLIEKEEKMKEFRKRKPNKYRVNVKTMLYEIKKVVNN